MSRGLGLNEVRDLFATRRGFRERHREELAMAGFLSMTELDGLGRAEVRQVIINGGDAGDHTVTGIAVGDRLISVLKLDQGDASADHEDLTDEFTITAADTINNAEGTGTTGDALLVAYEDLTP